MDAAIYSRLKLKPLSQRQTPPSIDTFPDREILHERHLPALHDRANNQFLFKKETFNYNRPLFTTPPTSASP